MRQQRWLSGERSLRGCTQVAARLDTSQLGALEQLVKHSRDFGAAHGLTSGRSFRSTTGPRIDLSAALIESGTRSAFDRCLW